MEIFRRSNRTSSSDSVDVEPPKRLHIGSGRESLKGWINIDNQGLPGVDQVLDVRHGLPFADVGLIYAEHFLEHLSIDEGLGFLAECRRVLQPGGILRLSTPNLDWVIVSHYRGAALPDEDARTDCFRLNRAFHGWGHQFLYNRATLAAALKSVGFAQTTFRTYGESDIAELKGLERHETWEDTPDLPHVLIVEASGTSAAVPLDPEQLKEFREAIGSR
jgi:predicted SAM-dependent methyltransferase